MAKKITPTPHFCVMTAYRMNSIPAHNLVGHYDASLPKDGPAGLSTDLTPTST